MGDMRDRIAYGTRELYKVGMMAFGEQGSPFSSPSSAIITPQWMAWQTINNRDSFVWSKNTIRPFEGSMVPHRRESIYSSSIAMLLYNMSSSSSYCYDTRFVIVAATAGAFGDLRLSIGCGLLWFLHSTLPSCRHPKRIGFDVMMVNCLSATTSEVCCRAAYCLTATTSGVFCFL